MSTPDRVLADFVDAWSAGRRPRVLDYLARVPGAAERDELADRIAAWLLVAPAPVLDDVTRAQIRREPVVAGVLRAADELAGAWPQLVSRLRARAGLSVRDVAARIVERFGLRSEDTGRTEGYLVQLERGALEPSRVSHRLLDALGETIGAGGRALRDAATFGAGLQPAASPRWRAEEDELDRLFTGGPDG